MNLKHASMYDVRDSVALPVQGIAAGRVEATAALATRRNAMALKADVTRILTASGLASDADIAELASGEAGRVSIRLAATQDPERDAARIARVTNRLLDSGVTARIREDSWVEALPGPPPWVPSPGGVRDFLLKRYGDMVTDDMVEVTRAYLATDSVDEARGAGQAARNAAQPARASFPGNPLQAAPFAVPPGPASRRSSSRAHRPRGQRNTP
jgi:hypothetical protein